MRALTTALAEAAAPTYNGDPNVTLQSVLYNAKNAFVEDVAKAVLRYSTLRTPLEGKGTTYSSRGVSTASVKAGSGTNAATWDGMAAEVKMAGNKIKVTISDLDGGKSKSWSFPDTESPASIAANVSWYGTDLLKAAR